MQIGKKRKSKIGVATGRRLRIDMRGRPGSDMSRFHYWSMIGSTIWFSALAGCLNAFATVALLYERSSHMSGRSTDLGRGLMVFFKVGIDEGMRTKLFEEALIVLIIVVSFVAGAIVATKVIKTVGFGKTIMIVGALIGVSSMKVFMGVPSGVPDVFSFARSLWALILPFAMGMQNATTSLTTMGRTTHVTGTLTDLGIAIFNREYKNVIHFSSMWVGFVFGGAIGALMFFYVPSHFTQLLVLTIAFVMSGGFFAHPAVRRRLDAVLQIQEHRRRT